MSPFVIVAIIVILLLLAALLVLALTKPWEGGAGGGAAGGPGHDHSKGEANCPACQAAAKTVKVKIPMACAVHFRPKTGWKGEFGFDWLRIGDVGEDNYKTLITGGHKSVDAAGTITEYTKVEAYAALKNEYKKIATVLEDKPDNLKEYFVPYLNLYPKGTAGTPTPPFEAELKIMIAVKAPAPDKIEFEYDNTLFTLDKPGITDKAVGDKREASDKTVKITCIKEFSGDQEIKVWAYPAGVTAQADATLVGKLIACANHAAKRKELKFVFVKVKTKVESVERKGSFGADEKTNLTNALHQALIHGVIEDGPDLDLTHDAHFKIKTNASGHKTVGKFIKKTASGILNEDKKPDDFFAYVKQAYLAKNAKYNTYFTVFAFGEQGYDAAQGQIHSVGGVFQKNLILFKVRDTTTLNHEALHGLKLQHAHREASSPAGPTRKYTFADNKTDNVMAYVPLGISTWHWQWDLMQQSV
jgi:type VI secretion system secreted protein VgrG